MSGSCASPDFAAIAAQILDKSFSADGLMPTHEQAEKYFGGGGTMDLKSSQPSIASKITVAAAKQNVANVAARIAAIEQKDRAQQKVIRQVIQFSCTRCMTIANLICYFRWRNRIRIRIGTTCCWISTWTGAVIRQAVKRMIRNSNCNSTADRETFPRLNNNNNNRCLVLLFRHPPLSSC